MEYQDRQAFALVMETLAIAFKTELTEARLSIYWEDLEDFPLDAVVYACRMHRRDAEKFPVPKELRALASAYQAEQRLQAQSQSDAAYAKWFRERTALIDAATDTGTPPPRDEIPPEARAMLDRLYRSAPPMRSIPPLHQDKETH